MASPFGECPLPVAGREHVLLGHGSGGLLTEQLLRDVILPAFANPVEHFKKEDAAGSMGERNTCFKFSRGRIKSQGLSWALIQT